MHHASCKWSLLQGEQQLGKDYSLNPCCGWRRLITTVRLTDRRIAIKRDQSVCYCLSRQVHETSILYRYDTFLHDTCVFRCACSVFCADTGHAVVALGMFIAKMLCSVACFRQVSGH